MRRKTAREIPRSCTDRAANPRQAHHLGGRLAEVGEKVQHQQGDAAIETSVAIGHATGIADVESRAPAARPQPRGGDRFMVAVDADNGSCVSPTENRARQAPEPATDVEYDLAFADPAEIEDRLGQTFAPAAHKALVPGCEVHQRHVIASPGEIPRCMRPPYKR